MTECYRCEYVKCGRGCGGCPHGPYWYAYWWQEGKTHKRYIGKADPRPAAAGPARDWREAINHRDTACLDVACRILGLNGAPTRDAAFAAFRRLMAQHHPDRGGDPREAGFVSAAFSWLKGRMGW